MEEITGKRKVGRKKHKQTKTAENAPGEGGGLLCEYSICCACGLAGILSDMLLASAVPVLS